MNGFFEALRLEMMPNGVGVLAINPGDMYSDDGAGRTFFGPDGRQHKIDLSIKRDNDIARAPASAVAKKCAEAILDRRRDLDVSPLIQKLGTVGRAIVPAVVDRIIYHRVGSMRSAFASEADLHAKHESGKIHNLGYGVRELVTQKPSGITPTMIRSSGQATKGSSMLDSLDATKA